MKLPRIRGRYAAGIIVIALIALLAFLVFGKPNKAHSPNSNNAANVQQGVHIEVRIKSGNCMPQAVDPLDKNPSPTTCKNEPYTTATKIIIKQKQPSGAKKTIKEADLMNGIVDLSLPPGDYSSYVMYNDKEYCNNKADDLDCGFSVKDDQATKHQIIIDQATY